MIDELPRPAAASRIVSACALLLGCLSLGACSWLPGLEDPELRLQPRMYLLKPEGDARMQSFDRNGGGVQNNAPMDLSRFGMNGRDEDYGGIVSLGDGFSGIDASFLDVEADDTTVGTLTQGFGELARGARVNSEISYTEWRLGYVAEFIGHRFQIDDDDDVELKAGAGAEIVHRDGQFDVYEVEPFSNPPELSRQKIDFNDNGVVYMKLRTRGRWRNLALQVDWSFSPGLVLGGEFTGDMNDVEVVASYLLDPQDIKLLVGYRWSQLPTSGSVSGLQFDTDFQIDGYLVGLEVGF